MFGKNAGVDPEIFKRGAVFYISHDGWITKKILPLTWSKKARIMLETISLLAKHFDQYFKCFFIFISNESLPANEILPPFKILQML